MSKDVTSKPVHFAVLKQTHLDKLRKEGKLPKRQFSTQLENHSKLPRKSAPTTKVRSLLDNVQFNYGDYQKKLVSKTRLKVLHQSVPPIPKEQEPPCDSCKTAACCYAFVVQITEEEYESGVYGDYAIKISGETVKQFGSKLSSIITMGAPQSGMGEGDKHYLEGVMGEPCPFLGDDARCTIYEYRPVTCRAYTCVGDDRITQEMRDGDVDLEKAVWDRLFNREG